MYEESSSYRKKGPFQSVIAGTVSWEAPQEEKEKQARKWMESYVQTILLKKSRQTNPKSIQHSLKHIAAEDDVLQGRERIASFQREGTGRYDTNQSLQSCIANEKGLLNKDDFEHVQKVIEVYSKALLCEIRQRH